MQKRRTFLATLLGLFWSRPKQQPQPTGKVSFGTIKLKQPLPPEFWAESKKRGEQNMAFFREWERRGFPELVKVENTSSTGSWAMELMKAILPRRLHRDIEIRPVEYRLSEEP